MKDMSIIANKKIINKETNEVRLVVSIDEENRKIHSVPADEPNAEPSIMAAASYDRRWKLYEEPEAEAEVSETAEPEVNHDEPMKMSDVVTKLESLFDILNRVYFDNALPKPVITVQSIDKYHVGPSALAELMGANAGAVGVYLSKRGFSFKRGFQPTKDDLERFREDYGISTNAPTKKITLENFSFCFSGAFNAASFVKQIKAFVPEGQLLRVSVAVEVVEPEPSATEPATEEKP